MMLHAEAIALEHLLVMDEKTQEPQPNLATEWSYDDSQTVLTVKLREGVKFHDGSDLPQRMPQHHVRHIQAHRTYPVHGGQMS